MQITITKATIWPIIWLFIGTCLGFLGGIAATSHKVDMPTLEKNIDADAQIAELKEQLLAQKIVSDGWQKKSEACDAQSQIATILYEPGAPPTIALFNGAINVQPGASLGVTIPSGPRWIVPAKVQPRVITAIPGVWYSYFDLSTQRLDGPYIPLLVSAGNQPRLNSNPAPIVSAPTAPELTPDCPPGPIPNFPCTRQEQEVVR